jgi:uncharacterized Zn finger protein (UPF0148 family)
MGSVMSDIDCPNCKREAFEDFYYKSGEEYIFCKNCGYHKSATIINRDKLLTELTDEDWKIYEVKNPFAAFTLKTLESVAMTCGTLATEIEFEQLKESVRPISSTLEVFCISRMIGDDIVEIDVLKEIK